MDKIRLFWINNCNGACPASLFDSRFQEEALKKLVPDSTCKSSLIFIKGNYRLSFASNPHYGDQLLPHHLFSFVWYTGVRSGQSPFWKSVRNLYLKSFLIKFKD